MPVDKLYVEGKLDNEIYTPLFSDAILIVRGVGKHSIRSQAKNDRDSQIRAGYLRDRDFDFDPPQDMDVPTVDISDASGAWGWRLNRHEIESYLLDPRIVNAKFGIPVESWQTTICEAAKRIRWYQIARWTVGYARSKLPPNYKLQTQSDDVGEMRLPEDLSESASLDWCRATIRKFFVMIESCLSDNAVGNQIDTRSGLFAEAMLDDHQDVFRWCSGKDLFAALSAADLQITRAQSPQSLCNILRDWVREHPDQFLRTFPELVALKQQMTGQQLPI